jgi:hypothetical protein
MRHQLGLSSVSSPQSALVPQRVLRRYKMIVSAPLQLEYSRHNH